ncbi:MAG TPA: LptF/LptG family permease, partial [bacterium]|nr:LptF/LptG family permease [bacterium]
LVRGLLIRIGAATGAFLTVSVIVDLFERLDTFIDHDVPALTILNYYVATLPYLFVLILPVACLIAALFVLGGMARRNELIAMTASGISLYRILIPVWVAGGLLALVGLGFTVKLVPWGNHVSTTIYDHEIKGRPMISGSVRRDLNYLGADGRFFLIRRFDGDDGRMEDVVVQQFADGTLVRRIDAKRADWTEDDHWVFHEGFIRRFQNDRVEAEAFEQRVFDDISERPADFLRLVKEPDEMSLRELRAHVKRTEASGGDATKLKVDEQMRYSFPFASFIVMLLTAPLSGAIRRGGHALGFGLALLVSFTYYVLLEVGKTFGYNATFPPALAAWLPNLVFAGLGVFGLVRTRK